MPTAKPRLNLTLDPAMADLIGRLAEGREVPRSRVITDLLDAVAPQLEGLAALLEAAKRAPGAVHDQLATALTRAQDQLSPEEQAIDDGLQLNIEDAIAQATAAARSKTPSATPPAA